MAGEPERDLFARRNRLRIVGLVLLATVNYWLAVCAAAIATGLVIVFYLLSEGGFDDLRVLFWLVVGVAVLGVVIGTPIALVQVPLQRSRLERRVFQETGARMAAPDEQPRVRNILEALAIAADIPAPQFAIVDDPAPNSFGVGTSPKNTVVAVTTGLVEKLARPELEAILSYEISRIRSFDVSLSSWTVALTSGAINAVDDGGLTSIIGWLPMRFAQWIQLWALRGQGVERDRAAVRFTRNPGALIGALERLAFDTIEVRKVSRATAPLWVEVPSWVFRLETSSKPAGRLGQELLLDQRIDALRALVGAPAATVPPGPPPPAPPATTARPGPPPVPPAPPPSGLTPF